VIVAGVCVLGGVLRLLAQVGPVNKPSPFAVAWSTLLGTRRFIAGQAGWESAAVISMVVLETLHHSRPWHTAVLVLVVVSYLLAVHQAEQPVPVVLWRGEVKVLVVSLPLVAVATGVAMAPAAGAGNTSGGLEVIAALAAVTAGALALPL